MRKQIVGFIICLYNNYYNSLNTINFFEKTRFFGLRTRACWKSCIRNECSEGSIKFSTLKEKRHFWFLDHVLLNSLFCICLDLLKRQPSFELSLTRAFWVYRQRNTILWVPFVFGIQLISLSWHQKLFSFISFPRRVKRTNMDFLIRFYNQPY